MNKLMRAVLLFLLVIAVSACAEDPPSDVGAPGDETVEDAPAASAVEDTEDSTVDAGAAGGEAAEDSPVDAGAAGGEAVKDTPANDGALGGETAEDSPANDGALGGEAAEDTPVDAEATDDEELAPATLPERKLTTLIDALADKHGVYNPDIAKEIQKRGAEAIPPLLEAAFDTQNAQEQVIYAHVLVRIDVEPDRFEAIKKLLEHPNLTVQTRAVDALTRLGHPEEAVDLAIEFTKHEETLIRYTAYRSLRFAGYPKRMREVCTVLRRGLNDPIQIVRETAQRSIEHLRDERNITCP